MNTINKKNLIIPLLFTIAIIIASCSSTNPYIGNVKSNIQNQNYDSALASSERHINQNPADPIGYYYKGVALGQKGQAQDDPAQGTPMFKQMNDAFGRAKQIADTMSSAPDDIKNIPSVKVSLWRNQHNSAIKLLQSDSLKQTVSNPQQRALNYLKNATIIEPDSALSWNVLAIIQNRRQKYGEAAKAEEKYISLADSVGARDYLLLSQFYRMDKQNKKSLNTLEKAHQQFPKNSKIVQNMADAYNNNGNAEKSIAIVKELVKQNPQNPQYHIALGTQIYKSSITLQNKYDKNVDKIIDLQQKLQGNQGNSNDINQQIENLKQKNKQLENKINNLIDQATEQLHQTLQYRKNDDKAYYTLGVVYQNEAKTYFDKRNMTLDNAKAKQYDSKANSALKKAVNNYQHAVKIAPNKKKYWKNLYEVYNALGMDKKAKEAKKKAGMQ